MKHFAFLTVLLSLLIVTCSLEASEKESVVTKILSGDTVVLESGETLRYIGIEAPHLKKSEGGPQFFAREAARQNKGLVLMKKVRLEFDKELKDSEGRLLAYVYVKKLFVNGELVKSGHARAAAQPPNVKYRDLLAGYEKEAIARYTGLWQEKKQESDTYYVGNKRTYVFHRPSCPQAKKVPEKSRIIFRKRTDPISVGFVPCKICKP
jgi:micrococcal nuclease